MSIEEAVLGGLALLCAASYIGKDYQFSKHFENNEEDIKSISTYDDAAYEKLQYHKREAQHWATAKRSWLFPMSKMKARKLDNFIESINFLSFCISLCEISVYMIPYITKKDI